ncbi:MAG: hypothetical protein OEY09_02505 [Gammaproteobacteria bacterium]|nr:hypothetical protein [Gammaproteobacteria bacterium]
MYGLDTVFVPVGDQQQDRIADCLECAVCLIQANLKGLLGDVTPQAHPGYLFEGRKTGIDSYALSSPHLFLLFQSRAPPA